MHLKTILIFKLQNVTYIRHQNVILRNREKKKNIREKKDAQMLTSKKEVLIFIHIHKETETRITCV